MTASISIAFLLLFFLLRSSRGRRFGRRRLRRRRLRRRRRRLSQRSLRSFLVLHPERHAPERNPERSDNRRKPRRLIRRRRFRRVRRRRRRSVPRLDKENVSTRGMMMMSRANAVEELAKAPRKNARDHGFFFPQRRRRKRRECVQRPLSPDLSSRLRRRQSRRRCSTQHGVCYRASI